MPLQACLAIRGETALPVLLLPSLNLRLLCALQEAVQSGGRVLVHCLLGVSESASLVVAYLMASPWMQEALLQDGLRKEDLASSEAILQWVQQKRAVAQPSQRLCDQAGHSHQQLKEGNINIVSCS